MTINTELYFYNQLKILLNQGNLKPNEFTGILKSGLRLTAVYPGFL